LKWNDDFIWPDPAWVKGAWIHAGYGDVSATRHNEMIHVNGHPVKFGEIPRYDEELLKITEKGYVNIETPKAGLSNPFLSGERGFYVSDRVMDAVMKQIFENKFEKGELNENTIQTEMMPTLAIIIRAMMGTGGAVKTNEELKSSKLKQADRDLERDINEIEGDRGNTTTGSSPSKLGKVKALMNQAMGLMKRIEEPPAEPVVDDSI